ncbi:hypothetical protein [Streptomyces sp. NPDC002133]|uniref:hypothetical protein n=1 Tax=Streptomyces sp. NPDC002133 TaxID=3154409 RepID=UPI00332AF25E
MELGDLPALANFRAAEEAFVPFDGQHDIEQGRHAQPLGRSAGHNVAADLFGADMVPFSPFDPCGTTLDLGAAGALVCQGWDRQVAMTGQEAKKIKVLVNTQMIYPPVDDVAALFKMADYRYSPMA